MSLSFWAIVDPEYGKNYVLNPSAGATGNFTARGSATATRDTAYAHSGLYSYKVATTASGDGIDLTLEAFPEHSACVSLYLHGVIPNQLQASLDGTNWNDINFISGSILDALRKNMAAHWPLNEASGNALGATGNGINLTDNNSVTSYDDGDGAAWRQFSSATSEYLSSTDNATLSGGNVDFSFELEVVLDSKGITRTILTKGTADTVAGLEYRLVYNSAVDRFRWFLSDGTNFTDLIANALGSPEIGVPYHIYVWHDSVNDIAGIRINDQYENTSSFAFGVQDTAGSFRVGLGSGGSNPMNGRVRRLSFFKNRLLSGAEITALYNGGNGIDFTGNRWSRMGVLDIPIAQANGSTTLRIRQNGAGIGNFWIDDIGVEATNGYITTPIHGDMPGLYRWTGLRHGSSSTRDAQERGGGRERDLLNDYGIVVRAGEGSNATSGIGMPPQQINTQPLALQPGNILQSVKVLPREIVLDFAINTEAGSTWATMHQNRQKLINLIKTSRVRGTQPFVIRYIGNNALDANNAPTSYNPLYARFVYQSGLEFYNVVGFMDTPQVRLYGSDPFWYEDNQAITSLAFDNNVSNANRITAKLNGAWQALGSGLNGAVRCLAEDKIRGRVYVGGAFTTANGVTVNRFAYWDNNLGTFVAMGGATKGVAGGDVYCMAVDSAGNVWLVGAFTSAGGSTTKGVARWNIATDTFTVFNLTTTSGSIWASVVISPYTGKVFLAGNFVDWNGSATQDYVTSYTPSTATWAALGTQPYSAATEKLDQYSQTMAIDRNGDLIIGSYGTAGGSGTLRKFTVSTSAWSLLLTTAADKWISAVFVKPDNTYVLSGNFTTVGGVSATRAALYNGSVVSALGTGLDDSAYWIAQDQTGLLLFVGPFTVAGDVSPSNGFAYWNGYVWTQADMDMTGVPSSIVVTRQGDIYLSSDGSGTASAASITTVTNSGSEKVFPKIIITGPTTADTRTNTTWIENLSTGDRLYLDIDTYNGDTVTIDLTTGKKNCFRESTGELISGQPLQGSDVASFNLLPGDNSIACQSSQTLTGVTMTMVYTPTHVSVDGGS